MNARLFGAWALGCALLSAVPSAQAFCGATTCDRAAPNNTCLVDRQQCVTSGEALFWNSSCVTFNVQADGARKHDIDYATTEASVKRAFAAWTSAPCGNGVPAIDVQIGGPVECRTSEYNKLNGNANIVMFREDEWPYVGSEDSLGITRLRFDKNTGELWDADIEVNAVAGTFSVEEPVVGVDLDSLLTHEAGHALGLAHSLVEGATMTAGYTNDTALRSLEEDDIAGICAIYPPGLKAASSSCDARHGFAELCGADQPEPVPEEEPPAESSSCSLTAPPRPFSDFGLLAVGAALLVAAARRRR